MDNSRSDAEPGARGGASIGAMVPDPWVVRGVSRESADVVTLEIEPLEPPERLPEPGQFHMLYVFGVGEVPISLAGLTASGRVLHTVRDVGPVSHALCQLGVGDTVGVRGPFGSAWPLERLRGRDVILAAGGVGMAPLRPVVEAITRDRSAYGEVALLYGARRPSELIYDSERLAWCHAGIQVEVTVDHADRSWRGHVGVVTTLIRHARFDPPNAAAIVCGPEVMMTFMAREVVGRGVPSERVYLTMERNMKCAIGHCGHCQLGPEFVCIDGPVFSWPRLEPLLVVSEL